MQHDASQQSKGEKAKGTSASAGLNEEPGREGKKAKAKVKEEFPAASKNGPVIGLEDERGGVSFSWFSSCSGGGGRLVGSG